MVMRTASSCEMASTPTHLYVFMYRSQNWLRGPHSGGGGGEPAVGKKTGGSVGSGGTGLISPAAGPPSAVGYSCMGLQDPSE